MQKIETYAVPLPTVFGPGALKQLRTLARRFAMSRPLVVTDPGIRDCGLLDRALEALGKGAANASLYDEVQANPREEGVRKALERYRETDSDGIIGLGGGSALDTAKALRLITSHTGPLVDYDLLRGGEQKVTEAMPPFIAIPTTAGTGSEVSRGALIVTREGDVVRKTVVASPRLLPSAAVLDPELTVNLPPALTAGTGMDALTHAVEELVSPREHPLVEAIASGAVERIRRALPRVWKEPGDVDARGDMLVASMMGGIGFEKGLGVIHSLAHAIGALHDLHHGLLNAVCLPMSIEFNRKHTRPGVLADLARRAGLDVSNDDNGAERLMEWFRELKAELAIPERLHELKDISADREEIIDRALDDHCHRTNPRPCTRDDFYEFWEMCW